MLSLSQKEVYVAEVQHYFCAVDPMDKDRALIRIIEMENPASAIIFCNTKANVHYVCGVLRGFGYNADELLRRSHPEPQGTVSWRRSVKARFAFSWPQMWQPGASTFRPFPMSSSMNRRRISESYIHRAGRTGRAGAAGRSHLPCGHHGDAMELDRIARHYNINIMEMKSPTDEEVAAVKARTAFSRSSRAASEALPALKGHGQNATWPWPGNWPARSSMMKAQAKGRISWPCSSTRFIMTRSI